MHNDGVVAVNKKVVGLAPAPVPAAAAGGRRRRGGRLELVADAGHDCRVQRFARFGRPLGAILMPGR
jgi:hypothetical protein